MCRDSKPLSARVTLIKSIVLSHLTHSIPLLTNLSVQDEKKITRQIKWAVRIAHHRHEYDSISETLLRLKLMTFEQNLKYHCLVYYHKLWYAKLAAVAGGHIIGPKVN